MKAENTKKKDAGNWQDHLAKKANAAGAGGNTEIQRPVKKQPVKPMEAKEPKAEKKEAGNMHDEKHKDSHKGVFETAKAPVKEGAEKGVKALKEGEGGTKAAGKEAKAQGKKEPKAKKKKVKQKSRKVIVKAKADVAGNRDACLHKGSLPTFRGRFGKRNIRRKSIAKWNRWRVPRGIDVKREMSDGYMPRVGFATPKAIRHLHPSGYREVIVRTLKEVETVSQKGFAVRIAAGIGSRKKMIIVDKAIARGLRVLNP